MNAPLPYKIACLCDLRDQHDRVLLLRRVKEPNLGMCSPIGGKLDMGIGESPAQNARREIMEEAGIDVPLDRLHLTGLISEAAYEGRTHWLIFWYRVIGPVWTEPRDTREGRLDWFTHDEIKRTLPIPDSDKRIIWPLVYAAEADMAAGRAARPGFFAVHIDCSGGDSAMTWEVQQQEAGR